MVITYGCNKISHIQVEINDHKLKINDHNWKIVDHQDVIYNNIIIDVATALIFDFFLVQ
jgi:hypothetical protein